MTEELSVLRLQMLDAQQTKHISVRSSPGQGCNSIQCLSFQELMACPHSASSPAIRCSHATHWVLTGCKRCYGMQHSPVDRQAAAVAACCDVQSFYESLVQQHLLGQALCIPLILRDTGSTTTAACCALPVIAATLTPQRLAVGRRSLRRVCRGIRWGDCRGLCRRGRPACKRHVSSLVHTLPKLTGELYERQLSYQHISGWWCPQCKSSVLLCDSV